MIRDLRKINISGASDAPSGLVGGFDSRGPHALSQTWKFPLCSEWPELRALLSSSGLCKTNSGVIGDFQPGVSDP